MTVDSNSKSRCQSNGVQSTKPVHVIDTAKRAPLKRTGNLNPRTSDLLVAIRRVLGSQVLNAQQILEGLKQCSVVLRTREPEPHLRWILSSHPALFERATEERGRYRLHADDPFRAEQSAADDDGQQCSPMAPCGT